MRIIRWYGWGVILKLNLIKLGKTHQRSYNFHTAITHSLTLLFLPFSLPCLIVPSLPLTLSGIISQRNHLHQALASGSAFKGKQMGTLMDHHSSCLLSLSVVWFLVSDLATTFIIFTKFFKVNFWERILFSPILFPRPDSSFNQQKPIDWLLLGKAQVSTPVQSIVVICRGAQRTALNRIYWKRNEGGRHSENVVWMVFFQKYCSGGTIVPTVRSENWGSKVRWSAQDFTH